MTPLHIEVYKVDNIQIVYSVYIPYLLPLLETPIQ